MTLRTPLSDALLPPRPRQRRAPSAMLPKHDDMKLPKLEDGQNLPFNIGTPILGVDASVGKSGFALAYKGKLITWKHEIKPSDGPQRMVDWRRYMNRLVQIFEIQHMVIEGYSFGSRGSRSHSTGEIGGIHRMIAYDHKINLLVASPASAKMFGTGKGNSPKSAIPLGLYKKYTLDIPNEDEADAATLCMLGAGMWFPESIKLLDYQAKSLKKIEKYLDWGVH